MIMYCNDKNPLLSILMEILLESCSALVDGLRRLILYLKQKKKYCFFEPRSITKLVFISQWPSSQNENVLNGPYALHNEIIIIPVGLCLLALKGFYHVRFFRKIGLKSIRKKVCSLLNCICSQQTEQLRQNLDPSLKHMNKSYMSASSMAKCWKSEIGIVWWHEDLKNFTCHVQLIECFLQAFRLQ